MSVTLYDNPLVQAYYEKIFPSLAFVETTDVATSEVSTGTATVIGHAGNDKDGYVPILATAGHMLPSDATQKTRFRLTRYDFTDPAHPSSRTGEFTIPHAGGFNSPGYIRVSGKPGLSHVDIGIVRGPSKCTDSNAWFTSNNPSSEVMSIQGPSKWAASGSEVAWAGFPAIAANVAGRPQPCYYHGVVSSLLIKDEFQAYLLDGHNTFGISGGPVWWIDGETNLPNLIGVISSYLQSGHAVAMPGLVFATPIQTLLATISPDYAKKAAAMGE